MPNDRDDYRRNRGGWGRPEEERGAGPRRMERSRFPEEERGRWRGDDLAHRSVGSPGIGGGTGNRYDQRGEYGREEHGGREPGWRPDDGRFGGREPRFDRFEGQGQRYEGRGSWMERERERGEWDRGYDRPHEEYTRYQTGERRMGGMGDEDWSPAQSTVERMGRGWGGDIGETPMGGGAGYDLGQVGRGMRPMGGYGTGHRGKGPMNYTRADERIREDVCDCLTEDDHVDASQIDLQVSGGEVTLTGTVPSREMKRRAEELVERQRGVKDVHNQLRVARESTRGERERSDRSEERGGDGDRGRNGLTGRGQHHPS
jgi:hypothetical protein